MRPRDIIQLANACRDTARNNKHDRIEETDIRKAISIYSNWKLGDLQTEWGVNYPFLVDVFMLFSNSGYMFNRTSFEETLGRVQVDLTTRYPNLAHFFSPVPLLSVLYSIGFLGTIRHGKTYYAYTESMDRQIQMTDKEFVLHPCFRNALQSISAIKLSPFDTELDNDGRGRLVGLEPIGIKSTRGVGYFGSDVRELRLEIGRSNMPDEVRVELQANLAAVEGGLRGAFEVGNPVLVGDAINRAHRHLLQLNQRLEETPWLTVNRDFKYRLEDSVRQLERFIYEGDLGEFRGSGTHGTGRRF
jgi:hypothetical protein